MRRQSEAAIRHEEGFEVVTRRRRRKATGSKTKVVVEEVGLCRSSSRKDISCCGGSAVWGTLSAKAQGGEAQTASGFTVRQQELACSVGRVSLGAGQVPCSCFHFGFDKLYLPNWQANATPRNPG